MSLLLGVGKKIAELTNEVVTNSVRFENLQTVTTETLVEFKSLLQRFEDKLQQVQIEHIRERAELNARIQVLEGRLDSLSEQALHAVAEKAAREMMRTNGDGFARNLPTDLQVSTVCPPAQLVTGDSSPHL